MNGKAMKKQLTVISTFAGGGGSSLGYKMAGYKELLAIDFDKNACETFALNFPEVPIWLRDINGITSNEILEFCKIKKGELDVFDGSPPCQGFSTIGKREINDSRNYLFEHFAQLIKELQPKVFIMENVSGLLIGKMKYIFNEIFKELESCGYVVKVRLLNAANYSVPQSRRRVIFIGVRNDIKIEAQFPQHHKKIITVKDALHNIKPITIYKLKHEKEFINKWTKMDYGNNCMKFNNNSMRGFNLIKIHPDKPCATIVKTFAEILCNNNDFSGSMLLHYNEPRLLSIEEVKALHSYPKDFKFLGTFEKQWARIGNSVPPLMMKAIAGCVRDNVLIPYYESQKSIININENNGVDRKQKQKS